MSIPSSGSSTARSASTTSSFVGMAQAYLVAEEPHLVAPLPGEEVDPVHEAHPVAAGAHHQRVRACAVRVEPDAAEQVAVADPRGHDDHLSRRELLGAEDPVHVVDPLLARLVDLAAGRRPELRLELAAEAAERCRAEYRLARAADPDREVVVR